MRSSTFIVHNNGANIISAATRLFGGKHLVTALAGILGQPVAHMPPNVDAAPCRPGPLQQRSSMYGSVAVVLKSLTKRSRRETRHG
jgi:hypothetical protein